MLKGVMPILNNVVNVYWLVGMNYKNFPCLRLNTLNARNSRYS